MINVNDFKPGKTFEERGNIYTVLESSHSKKGRGQANVKVKVKNLRTGTINSLTFVGGTKVKKAHIETTKIQYLYIESGNMVIMDENTFEQSYLSIEKIKWELNFLIENSFILITKYNDEILGVSLPLKVELIISETAPAIAGDTVGKATKDAILETGFKIQVPLFIKNGDIIIINTISGKYDSRKN